MSQSIEYKTGVKVSVCMITYNQEKLVAQAIESALAQETAFDYEIVIGEDCSTDHTRDIVLAFQQKYPGRVRVLASDNNLGANRNLVRTLSECRGQYIAWLEGDDFWTSPQKLQKQADFLDQHPDFSFCFHNVKAFYDPAISPPYLMCRPGQRAIFTIDDLLVANFIPSVSVMFRNGLIKEFPGWFFESKMGDWPLHVFNAQHGKIGYIDEVMACYRKHPGSSWSSQNAIPRLFSFIELYKNLDKYLDRKYSRIILPSISSTYLKIAAHYADQGDSVLANQYLNKSREIKSHNKQFSSFELLKLRARIHVPWIYRLFKNNRLISFVVGRLSKKSFHL